MYPYSPIAVLFLQVFGIGCIGYLIWQVITKPKEALKNVSYFIYLIGTVYGCAIAAAKFFPGEYSFIRGAALGVGIIAFVSWIMKTFRGEQNE